MTTYLVDKSAFEQQRHSAVAADVLAALARENQLATCEIVALDLLYSTRGPSEHEKRWAGLQSLVWLPVGAEVTQMALDIQRQLASVGQDGHPVPDVLIAATALVHGATVLHYDQDFDRIAAQTGQPVRWIIPRGTRHSRA